MREMQVVLAVGCDYGYDIGVGAWVVVRGVGEAVASLSLRSLRFMKTKGLHADLTLGFGLHMIP